MSRMRSPDPVLHHLTAALDEKSFRRNDGQFVREERGFEKRLCEKLEGEKVMPMVKIWLTVGVRKMQEYF